MAKTNLPKAQASQVTYELHSLGWKAFQDLCVSLVGEVWGQTVQGFFDSHDGGRDGAFHGTWNPQKGETYQGSFTVQCKFTAKADKIILLSDLKDDLVKAERLAAKGLADNYFLLTNHRLTGTNEEEIRVAFEAVGIKQFVAFGVERMSQIIQESSRLRMLVPRVYGLGDLSQILDIRAHDPLQEILSSMGHDLAKFVITDAYRKSAKALNQHGFVLLLGEPACGKSTIAAALSLVAFNEWGCSTIKVQDANGFKNHWNPHEPKQFFWIDDAFGTTQFDESSVSDWNRIFTHMHAAIKKGARILFTSRTYIHQTALNHLKTTAFPVINESQVVIHVENLSKNEREQILYNHIRLGTQPTEIKTQLKPHLVKFASHTNFSPEIARRLGDPMFTKNLIMSSAVLEDFVAHPIELLCDIIRTLDASSRAALALVFMGGGAIPCPLELTEGEKKAIIAMGSSVSEVRSVIGSLRGSMLINPIEEGNYTWRFKHPTIRDAFAELISGDSELLDIYLTGSHIIKLFNEVSCGYVGIEGVKVIVPTNRYDAFISRMEKVDTTNFISNWALLEFLAHRCNKEFFEHYLKRYPEFVSNLNIDSFLGGSPSMDLIIKLHKFALLPELKRASVVNDIRQLVVETYDTGFLHEKFRDFFTQTEHTDILEQVRTQFLPKIDDFIFDLHSTYDIDSDPSDHFSELVDALEDYHNVFDTNEMAIGQIQDAFDNIEEVIEDLQSEMSPEYEMDGYDDRSMPTSQHNESRSIFDDVDL